MPLPLGWNDLRVVTSGGPNPPGTLLDYGYEAKVKIPNSTAPGSGNNKVNTGGTYIVKFNQTTGQRQIYSEGLFGTRDFVMSINADGSPLIGEPEDVTGNNVYQNIAAQKYGAIKLKNIVEKSNSMVDALIASEDPAGLTADQKKRLLGTEEYSPQSNVDSPPVEPGAGAEDKAGPENQSNEKNTNAPVAPFGNVSSFNTTTKYSDGVVKYPEDANLQQGLMYITIYNYVVPDVFADGIGKGNPSILSGANISKRTLKENKGVIILPMPPNLVEANQTNWGENSMSNLAAGLMNPAMGAVTTAAKGDLFGAASVTVEAAKDIFGGDTSAKRQIQQMLTLGAAAGVIKKLGVQIDAEAFRARATGTVINPNLELLFNGPKLRTFQFTYRLTPRSLNEAKNIRKIIKLLKKAMAPKRSDKSNDLFFLGAPDIFRIDFKHQNATNTKLPSLKTCALTNFSANYTGDGYYSEFYDGQPTVIDINMTFTELTPIYNDHYDMGDDGVGFSGDLDDLENPLAEIPTDSSKKKKASSNPPPPPTPKEQAAAINQAAIIATQGTNIPGDPGFIDPNRFAGGTLFRNTNIPGD